MSINQNSMDSSRTIIRQQQDQQNRNGQYQSEQSEPHEHYNNNIIYTRNRAFSPTDKPHELPGNEIMEQIASAYRDNIGPTISRAAAIVIEDALRAGMEPITVIMAIEETGLASRPSPYYLRAILRNWAENGVVVSRLRDHISTTQARPWWK